MIDILEVQTALPSKPEPAPEVTALESGDIVLAYASYESFAARTSLDHKACEAIKGWRVVSSTTLEPQPSMPLAHAGFKPVAQWSTILAFAPTGAKKG